MDSFGCSTVRFIWQVTVKSTNKRQKQQSKIVKMMEIDVTTV